jgi:phytoene dehydrogenase-like protein
MAVRFVRGQFGPLEAGMSCMGQDVNRQVSPVDNSVIIIGAGISGLSVGCYLQMNGYETQIYELNSIPGGLCTSWTGHKPGMSECYVFDGCIEWLVGSSPPHPFHQMWCELLDMSSVQFVHHDIRFDLELDQADLRGERVFHLYADLERLDSYLKEIAPEDAAAIDEFIGSIRTLQKYSLPPLFEVAPDVRTWRHNLKLLTYLPFMLYANKWSKVTNYQFAARLRNPFLRAAFRNLFHGREMSLLTLTPQLAWFDQRCIAFPIGGSRLFASRIAERYKSLDGRLHLRAPVRSILVEKDCATGVELENGQRLEAGTVISAADGYWTIFKALGGQYINSSIRDLYDGKSLQVNDGVILVSLGMGRPFVRKPWLLRFPLAEPMTIPDGTCFDRLHTHIYNYDPTLAPAGKTVVTVTLYTRDHAYWTELRERNRDAYKAAKDSVARQVIDRLEARLGGIKDYVEAIDVATPATFIRYTHNWQGSHQGWCPPDNLLAASPISKTLPGLDRFYMTGHWVEPPGGVPIAAQSGRNLAQIICKRDGKRFVASRCPSCEGSGILEDQQSQTW